MPPPHPPAKSILLLEAQHVIFIAHNPVLARVQLLAIISRAKDAILCTDKKTRPVANRTIKAHSPTGVVVLFLTHEYP